MLKHIVRDYLQNWNLSSLSDLFRGKISHASICLMPVWAIIIVKINSSSPLAGDSYKLLVMVLSILIPYVLVYFSVMLHPVRLPKMFYLCPMTHQERANYVKRSYLFRIVMHMLILLCGMAVLVQNGSFHAAAVLLMLLNNLILSALIPIGKNETLGELCLVLLLSCNLIVDFAQLTILFDDAPHQIAQVMSYVIFFCLEVPLLVGCLKHIKRELASAADYMEEAGK